MGDPLDDLTEDELRALKDIARRRASDSVSRRDALKTGAAALGLGGLIGGGAGAAATGTASAGTDQTGTWGSPGNPQDFIAEDIYGPDGEGGSQSVTLPRIHGTDMHYESGKLGQIINTSYRNRPEYNTTVTGKTLSEIDKTEVTITGNISGVDETVWILHGIPENIYANFFVNIESSYPNKHIYIPKVHLSSQKDDKNGGGGRLGIIGDAATPSNAQVKSLSGFGSKGYQVFVEGIELQSYDPFGDEGAGVFVQGCDEWALSDVAFANGRYGVLSYSTENVMLNSVDFGSNLTEDGVLTKHEGYVTEQRAAATPTQGSVGNFAYNALSGQIVFRGASSTLTGTSGLTNTDDGIIRDSTTGRVYGISRGDIALQPTASKQGYEPVNVTLQTDEATTLDPTNVGMVFVSSRNASVAAGSFGLTSGNVITFYQNNMSNEGSTTLTGTTGTDGKVNIAYDGTDLYIENRSDFASSESFTLILAGQ